jgi:hypothetical protein
MVLAQWLARGSPSGSNPNISQKSLKGEHMVRYAKRVASKTNDN